MDLYDFPVRADRSLYDEAARTYARRVASRSDAVYLGGNVTYPGLSDLDIIVITRSRNLDNAQYFDTYSLDNKFQPLILHGPLVVPASHLGVLKYTVHVDKPLLYGTDVLAGLTTIESPEERWCKLLEQYCWISAYMKRAASGARLSGRRLIAKASGQRFALRHADALLGTSMAPGYVAAVDAIRSTFFERDARDALLEAWSLYRDACATLSGILRERLALEPWDSAEDFAHRFFSGAETLPGVSSAYVRERSAAIDAYHEELARMRLPYGQIFFWEAHGYRSRLYVQSAPVNFAYRAKYRALRLLNDLRHGTSRRTRGIANQHHAAAQQP